MTGTPFSMLFRFFDKIHRNEDGTAQNENAQNENGAVHKKLLRQNVDDLIGAGIEEPVFFAWEEDGMEHRKGTVKVQCRQTAHNEKDCRQSRPRPEQGAAAQQSAGPPWSKLYGNKDYQQ